MKSFTIYTTLQYCNNITETVTQIFKDCPLNSLTDIVNISFLPFSESFLLSSEKEKKYSDTGNLYLSIADITNNTNEFFFYLNEAYNYFLSYNTKNEKIVQNVLIHLTMIDFIFRLTADEHVSSAFYELCERLLKQFNGFALLDDIILIDKNSEIILNSDGTPGNAEINKEYAVKSLSKERNYCKETYDRTINSVKKLMANNIPVYVHIPSIPDSSSVYLRTREEIAQRAVALLLFVEYSTDIVQGINMISAREHLLHMLERYDVNHKLTTIERRFIMNETPDETDAINYSWQLEAYWVLLWVLGLVDELSYPSNICNCQLASDLVRKNKNFHKFFKKTYLRDMELILDEADLTYRYGWACVNARINDNSIPANLNPSVVVERHRAFNWLLKFNHIEWDHINVDNYEAAMAFRTWSIL